jgi:uncharacterized membrane protein
LTVLGIMFIVMGIVIGNRYRRVVRINQTFFFWLGRERIVLNLGQFLIAVGLVLLALGIFMLWA